jgi:hypothetical protein
MVVVVAWWTLRASVVNQLLPSVVVQSCNFVLLVSISGEMVFGRGENPA